MEFWIGGVECAVFRGRAVNGAITSATCGKETCLVVLGEIEPDGFGLEVIEDVGEPALEGFNLMGEGLLKVE